MSIQLENGLAAFERKSVSMELKQFTISCLLTAMVMALELVAAITGEALVALTMLSALPIYFLGREHTTGALLSYGSVTLLLLAINPHQCLFFVATNGLLGLSLGICHRMIKGRVVSWVVPGLVLFMGTITIAFLLGWLVQWWVGVVLLPFCILYAFLYGLAAKRIYVRCRRLLGNTKL